MTQDLNFFSQIEPLELSKNGARKDFVPHVPSHQVRDYVTAQLYMNFKLSKFSDLAKYSVDPCLSTLGPTSSSRDRFFGWSLPHPTMGGHLVAKPVLFDYNAMSYYGHKPSTLVGKCHFCGGLLILPDHVVAIAFWWPEGLLHETLTPDIVSAWNNSEISVCWIHFLTDGVNIPGRHMFDLQKNI